MRARLFAVAGCLLLASCVTAERVPVLKTVCVPEDQLKGYTDAQKAQAKRELDQLGPNAMLGTMISDYAALQAADRVCLRGQI